MSHNTNLMVPSIHHMGGFMGSSFQEIHTCFSPQVSVEVAWFRGILFVVESDIVSAIVESDVKSEVDLGNLGVIPAPNIGVIIVDIFSLISCNSIIVYFVPRKANLVVHSLAMLALSFEEDSSWMESCPPSMEHLVQDNVST